jgi:hypothetical protein
MKGDIRPGVVTEFTIVQGFPLPFVRSYQILASSVHGAAILDIMLPSQSM